MAATVKEIQAAIDADFAAAWKTFQAGQEAYFAANKRYWQGLPTSAEPPADGAVKAADKLGTKPDYQAEDWAAFGVEEWTKAYSLEIHQYDGPNGAGFAAIVRATLGGKVFVRVKDSGPEPWRTQGWTQAVVVV